MSAWTRLRALFAGDAGRVADALKAEQFASYKTSELTKEHGRTAVGSLLSPHRSSAADGLTPAKLGSLLSRADNGDPEALLTLAEEMEERETHYCSVLNTRKLGVSGSPVVVEASGDSAHETALSDHVEELVQRPEFEGLVLDLMDGISKGFSCVEIVWARDVNRWEPERYEFRPQRHFTFDRDTMNEIRLRALNAPSEGVPLMPFKWLVHRPKLRSGVPIRAGLARTIAVAYACKKFTVQDWMAFLDVFGMPIRIGKFPASMADRKRELLRAVQQIGTDAAGVIPAEMEIELLEAKGGGAGTTLFQQTAEYWDKQISKIVLGQTMTADDGASLAQSKVHERVRFDIRAADARAVSATINRDLVKPFIDLNYGPQEVYPKVRIVCEEPEDTKTLMESVKVFVDLGGKVQMSEIRDRLGLMEPEDGAELLQPSGAALAALAPQPKPETGGDDAEEVSEGDGTADEDDEVEGDAGGGSVAELNRVRREGFAAKPKTRDSIDEIVDAELEEWEPLLDGTVGEALRRFDAAESYEDARAVLDELKRNRAELDIGPLVASLAKRQFAAAGLGDASDDVEA